MIDVKDMTLITLVKNIELHANAIIQGYELAGDKVRLAQESIELLKRIEAI